MTPPSTRALSVSGDCRAIRATVSTPPLGPRSIWSYVAVALLAVAVGVGAVLLLWLTAPEAEGAVPPRTRSDLERCLDRVAALPEATVARCTAEHWPAAEHAADVAGLADPALLLGLALVESGCQPVGDGGDGGRHYGATQIATVLHMRLLTGGGIQPWSWDVDEAISATGVVLSWLRALWPGLSDGQVLCAYGCGERGRGWGSCSYSRCIDAAAKRVRSGIVEIR